MMEASSRRRVVKVAVVGSGLAGLTAAYLLASGNPSPSSSDKKHAHQSAGDDSDERDDVLFDVHVFEKVRFAKLCSRFLPLGECAHPQCPRQLEYLLLCTL